MSGERGLPPVLTLLLTMKKIVVIDIDQELLPVSPSHMSRTTIMNAETGVRPPEAWETMQ